MTSAFSNRQLGHISCGFCFSRSYRRSGTASSPLAQGKVGSKDALGSARLLAFAAEPAHLNVLNILLVSLTYPTHTLGHSPGLTAGIPVVVLCHESDKSSQKYIFVNKFLSQDARH